MKIANLVSGYLDSHNYPRIFNRFPILARVVIVVNSILILRNWYVRNSIKKVRKKYPTGFFFLDAGCGMGEFALGVARRNPNATVLGIDLSTANRSLANQIAKSLCLKNIEFRDDDLILMDISNKYDLILCNSTLQFIKEDERALKNLYEAMKNKGTLILYVPIMYRRYLPYSDSLEKKYLSDFFYKYHDDFLMHRYRPEEISNKVDAAGFKINNVEYAYGLFGAIAFEIYSLILIALKKLPFVIAAVCLVIYLLSMLPVQLFLMMLDYFTSKSSGNGMLIVAEKT